MPGFFAAIYFDHTIRDRHVRFPPFALIFIRFFDLFQPLFEFFNLLFVFFHFGKDEVFPADFKFYFLEKVLTFLDKLPVLFVPRINKCLNNADSTGLCG
jgi:hypothetical protein